VSCFKYFLRVLIVSFTPSLSLSHFFFLCFRVVNVDDRIRQKLAEAQETGDVVTIAEGNEDSIEVTSSKQQPIPEVMSSYSQQPSKRKLDQTNIDAIEIKAGEEVQNTSGESGGNIAFNKVKREKLENEPSVPIDMYESGEEEDGFESSNIASIKQEVSLGLGSGSGEGGREVKIDVQEKSDTDSGLVKLLFPITSESELSKHAVYVLDVSSPSNNTYSLKNANTSSLHMIKTSVNAMQMLQLLKEKSIELKKMFSSNKMNEKSLKMELRSMVSEQRECLTLMGFYQAFEHLASVNNKAVSFLTLEHTAVMIKLLMESTKQQTTASLLGKAPSNDVGGSAAAVGDNTKHMNYNYNGYANSTSSYATPSFSSSSSSVANTHQHQQLHQQTVGNNSYITKPIVSDGAKGDIKSLMSVLNKTAKTKKK
jgi:hypothetical protein